MFGVILEKELLEFFLLVVVVSASGALSPGPLFFATIDTSMRSSKYAGVIAASGHMAFELPLVIAIGYGLWNFVNDPLIGKIIELFGAVALIGFGAIQLSSSVKSLRGNYGSGFERHHRGFEPKRSGLFGAFLVGFLFTALNPYFLMWWFTIGVPLIAEALRLGALYGILLMFVFHIWMDYAWLGLTGYAAAVGSKLFNDKARNVVSMILATIILLWGTIMLHSAVMAYIK